MSVGLKELQKWDELIQEHVQNFGLNCYPQEFDICDHHEMIGYMAYSGMPARYSHWSYGKSYEKQKTLYDYGVAGLPYEMVINSNPCLAYLMRDNTLLLQILTIAHVYGHNDFFANNFTFTSGIDARYTIEMFKNHANRIEQYIEDPSIGLEAVEATLDHAHALSLQRCRNLALTQLTQTEQKQRAWEKAQPKDDPFSNIHPSVPYVAPELNQVPLEPSEDLLLFIADHNPYMPDWQQDILRIVDREAQYFIPQIETKIMNEGWASLWHHRILNALKLEQGHHLEFLVRHNQVLRPTPGGLNPYHLGFIIWHDIERRWNAGETGQEFTNKIPSLDLTTLAENDTPGRRKLFEVRETDRDTSFLRRFLTVDIIREVDLIQHEKRGKDRVVTKVADDDHWEDIKRTLIANVGANSLPVIKIIDADHQRTRTLYLRHYHDGRDLQIEYAEHALKHIQELWGRNVLLETILNNKPTLLSFENEKLKLADL